MRAIAASLVCITLLLAGGGTPGAVVVRVQRAQPVVGEEFPDFALPDVSGQEVSLSSFRGRVILLSFWSCYTDTCFTSVRVIEGLVRDFGPQGLVAPTVCSDIPPSLEKDGYAGLIKRCGGGQILLIDRDKTVKGRFHVRKVPTTFLIGRDFVLRQELSGVPPLMDAAFRESVRSLVEEAPAAPSVP